MSYRRTLDAYTAAEDGDTTAAADLPLSEWAEARRLNMTPQTVAHNHAAHVSDAAHALRETLRPDGFDWDDVFMRGGVTLRAFKMERAARALLAAIGEAAE